jgi:ATP-dependent Lhr-like helicase
VLDSGNLVLYLEKGGRSLITRGEVTTEHLRALIGLAAAVGKVELQRVDGVAVVSSPLAPLLREAGFSSTHRGLVAYGAS